MNPVAPPECHDILRRTFGFPAFRGQQEAVISRVMAGAHTLALMPTGAGKSLCYQVPALARQGTAIVISPLIALMHDQIRSASAAGIRAASMTSADSDNAATAQAFRAGELDLLYVAPERASTPGFQALLERAEIKLSDTFKALSADALRWERIAGQIAERSHLGSGLDITEVGGENAAAAHQGHVVGLDLAVVVGVGCGWGCMGTAYR